jgi:adenosylcobinamide-GDP ribazoletransferase
MKKFVKQLLFAYGFLTVIPGLGKITVDSEDTGKSTVFYPVVGMTIGLGFYPISLLRGLSPLTTAVVMSIFLLIFSRALHADGLIDTFDGFLSGEKNKDKILAVMRDSKQGALGFIAAFSLYLLKICFFYEILRGHTREFPLFLMAVPALSRGGVAVAGSVFPYAGGEKGLGKDFVSSIGPRQAIFSFFLMLVFSFSRQNFFSLLYAPVSCVFWIVWGLICRGKIGGITGDTIGAGIELSEVFVLMVMYTMVSFINL